MVGPARLPEHRAQVVTCRLVPLQVRWVAVGTNQPVTPSGEDVGDLDDVALHPARDGDDLANPPLPVPVCRDVHDEVDAGRDRRYDEGVADVP